MTTANICKEQSCNEKIPGSHYLCYKHWQESQESVINECPDCGRYKNAQYDLCHSCGRKKAEATTAEPTTCKAQFCGKYVQKNFRLCRGHWREEQDGVINECPQCGTYKNARFDICFGCFEKDKAQNARSQGNPETKESRQVVNGGDQVRSDTFSERIAMLEEDRKAEDKRLLFDYQQGKCVYCGNEYLYSELEIEHMIPKKLGGSDNLRNCQLACKICNQVKGTMTDIQFRQKHAKYLPQTERTPANPPINPNLLRGNT